MLRGSGTRKRLSVGMGMLCSVILHTYSMIPEVEVGLEGWQTYWLRRDP